MTDDSHNQIDVSPAPYGRWPDGRPITQLEASAKQMDDWASRFGFSGVVRMGIANPHSEPEKWASVKIGADERLHSQPRPLSLPEAKPEPLPEPGLPPRLPTPVPQSWFRRLLNLFKGGR